MSTNQEAFVGPRIYSEEITAEYLKEALNQCSFTYMHLCIHTCIYAYIHAYIKLLEDTYAISSAQTLSNDTG